MFSALKTAAIKGLEPCPVQVEADISDGLPVFEMIGYLSSEVKEARERVRTALKNSGVYLPPKRITVNLAPANVRKEGNSFDLAISLAILTAIGRISPGVLENTIIVGELGLNGQVNPVRGVLNVVASAKKEGIDCCLVPWENEKEAALISGVKIIGVSSLKEFLEFLDESRQEKDIYSAWKKRKEGVSSIKNVSDKEGKKKPGSQQDEEYEPDYGDICGQEGGKRASLICAAGMHNILYIGPPGSGKTMLASRIPTILPDLSEEEGLELTKIYSVSGLLEEQNPLIRKRPFRSPHHTCTPQTLAGGGRIPKPGEISLANHGILFLDELPEFSRNTLEILRQPLEEGKIHLTRTTGNYIYPADFVLAGAMNPCNCGYYPDRNKCNCSSWQIQQYLGKISRPLLDRIDLCVEIPKVEYKDLMEKTEIGGMTSAEMKEQVKKAAAIQNRRYKNLPFRFNGQLTATGIKEFCILDEDGERFLKRTYEKMDFSVRGYHKILKTARTIADLDESTKISKKHIAEAVFYRSLDKKYWMG